MKIDESKILLNEFLDRWPIEKVQNLTLKEYVGLGNKDTFCQWVETKTRMLGSIKGMTSIKFGIYERKYPIRRPKNYKNDDKYSWLQGYGENRNLAFENTKRDIIKIIQLSDSGKFNEIDNIILPDLFKWKIAFLFSNERLIPIYKREVLFKIANHFGLKTKKNTTISEIQNVMMLNKPTNLNVFFFMRHLYDQFGNTKEKNEIEISIRTKRQIGKKRRATNERNTAEQIRTAKSSYIANQKHNKIQAALKKNLTEKYGENNVIMEENYVDIKLLQPNYISFYEVKSAPYASDCIKEALGQILLYSLDDNDIRPKNHIVVGQYPATENDIRYIDFLKRNLKLEFDYLSVEIE